MIKEAKLIPIIYANKDWFENRLIKEKLNSYYKWLAWWNKEAPDKIDKKEYQMIQYSNKGVVSGIKEMCDVNYSFVDYAKAKEYLESLSKISFVKLRSGLQDITLQFLSCYKWGKDLIEKIYLRLLKPKVKRKENPNYKNEVQKEFQLEGKAIAFLSCYLYSDDLFRKLYISITK